MRPLPTSFGGCLIHESAPRRHPREKRGDGRGDVSTKLRAEGTLVERPAYIVNRQSEFALKWHGLPGHESRAGSPCWLTVRNKGYPQFGGSQIAGALQPAIRGRRRFARHDLPRLEFTTNAVSTSPCVDKHLNAPGGVIDGSLVLKRTQRAIPQDRKPPHLSTPAEVAELFRM